MTAEAAAEGALLAPELAPESRLAPLADGEVVVPPHAAMTMPIEPIDRPTIAPRWMNSRRLSRPAT